MNSDEFAALPAGFKRGDWMKVSDPRGYFSGTSDIVVNLTTGELAHWSYVWYKPAKKDKP